MLREEKVYKVIRVKGELKGHTMICEYSFEECIRKFKLLYPGWLPQDLSAYAVKVEIERWEDDQDSD